MSAAIEHLRQLGHEDAHVAFAPGRINLIGEHTDYNSGFVLPAAIDRGVTAAVVAVEERTLTMTSLQRPGERIIVHLDSLAPGVVAGWSAYVAGAVWALAESVELSTGLHIVIDGNVPMGAGLSSSAAVECSVLVAASDLLGIGISSREIARIAQRAENEFVGVPTGSMDQVAAMLSEPGCALFFDVRDDSITPVPLQATERGLALAVIDTRAVHALVDGGYASRREACERAAEALSLTSLREVANLDDALSKLSARPDSETLIKRTRHVVTENARVLDAVGALTIGDFARLGALMSASHASLRDDFEVSCPELDAAVEASMRAGAVGARMMGGGFGGSALALIERGRLHDLRAEIERSYAAFGFEPAVVIEVEPGPGARLVTQA